jgi:hypothetical protein
MLGLFPNMKMRSVPLIHAVPVAKASSRGIGLMSHGQYQANFVAGVRELTGVKGCSELQVSGSEKKGEVRFRAAVQVQADITCLIQLAVPYVHIRRTPIAHRTANREQRILRLRIWLGLGLASQCFLSFSIITPILQSSVLRCIWRDVIMPLCALTAVVGLHSLLYPHTGLSSTTPRCNACLVEQPVYRSIVSSSITTCTNYHSTHRSILVF